MPPQLPFKKEIVYVTGVMEIFFGLYMLLKKPGKWFKTLLKLFLVAVFPANVYMALKKIDLRGKQLPTPLLWARLPLQWFLIKETDKL
ncbi:membrane protein [Macrococcus hajekii]|nr:membrane protein [Macrococcus hajekii]